MDFDKIIKLWKYNKPNFIGWEWENLFYNEEENLKFVEEIHSIKIYKRFDWTYKIMFNNNKNDLIYTVRSYKIVKTQWEFFYLKVNINQKYEDIIYKLPIKLNIKDNKINFIYYSVSGMRKAESLYEKDTWKSYISSIFTYIEELPTKDRNFIRKIFRFYDINGLGNNDLFDILSK